MHCKLLDLCMKPKQMAASLRVCLGRKSLQLAECMIDQFGGVRRQTSTARILAATSFGVPNLMIESILTGSMASPTSVFLFFSLFTIASSMCVWTWWIETSQSATENERKSLNLQQTCPSECKRLGLKLKSQTMETRERSSCFCASLYPEKHHQKFTNARIDAQEVNILVPASSQSSIRQDIRKCTRIFHS